MKIGVLGVGQTKFGEHWQKSLADLLAESQFATIANAKIMPQEIDAIFTGNMCAPIFSNQANLGSLASSILSLSVPSTTVEGACASGGLAIRAGIAAIESGQAKIVLVNGVEKMTDVSSEDVTKGLSAATSSEWEQIYGVTFPALNAMIARLYIETYGLTREQLASVSVQNHDHGFLNPYAHLQKRITIKEVLSSPIVADPLSLYDCSPVSDGAASIVLCNEEIAKKMGVSVYIIGSGQATDTMLVAERDDLLSWKATMLAAQAAYKSAGIAVDQIDVLELHDGFSITHIMALEDLGFFEKGSAGRAIEAGQTRGFVNPSGGLKSRGHPVGATGVAQAIEIVRQLRSECGARQVADASIGMTHNVGGCGSNVVVHIFRREL